MILERKKRRSVPGAPPFHCSYVDLLILGRSADRADTFAGTALNALIRVDYIFSVTLGNCVDRALSSACAASNAVIRNLESHL